MGLEVSRLARNNADWHRLLEICALADTLILDEDGVYDPANFNDRLLLGLKGTMSEAELHVLKARLRGGILNKVRRGEYRSPLPTGFVYDESGAVAFDPDAQVRETIIHFFDTFARVGSAHQTVKAFRDEGLPLSLPPSRPRRGRGLPPAHGLGGDADAAQPAVRRRLCVRAAGVRRTLDGKKTMRKRASGDWLACIPNAHPGYISWDRYQENLRLLAANGHGYDAARASPPREGGALLQGRAVCGRCGQYFRVRYGRRAESWSPGTSATAPRTPGEPNCQSLAGHPSTTAVGLLVAEKMTPAAVELAIETRREIEARYEEADHLRCRAIERAQIDADLAQRRFMMVDPQNRLVADTLESDWNEKLRVLQKSREERERARREDQVAIDGAVRDRLVAMTTDFRRLWSDPSTPNRERKRMLAHVVEDVTLVKVPAEGTTTDPCPLPRRANDDAHDREPEAVPRDGEDPAEVVALVDRLLDDHVYEIAEILNEQGIRPGGAFGQGRPTHRFHRLRVSYLVHGYGLRPRYDRLRDRGHADESRGCGTSRNSSNHTLRGGWRMDS